MTDQGRSCTEHVRIGERHRCPAGEMGGFIVAATAPDSRRLGAAGTALADALMVGAVGAVRPPVRRCHPAWRHGDRASPCRVPLPTALRVGVHATRNSRPDKITGSAYCSDRAGLFSWPRCSATGHGRRSGCVEPQTPARQRRRPAGPDLDRLPAAPRPPPCRPAGVADTCEARASCSKLAECASNDRVRGRRRPDLTSVRRWPGAAGAAKPTWTLR